MSQATARMSTAHAMAARVSNALKTVHRCAESMIARLVVQREGIAGREADIRSITLRGPPVKANLGRFPTARPLQIAGKSTDN